MSPERYGDEHDLAREAVPTVAYIPHLKLTFGGETGTREIWQCQIRGTVINSAGIPQIGRGELETFANNMIEDALEAVKTFWRESYVAGGWHRLTRVQLQPIRPDGQYFDDMPAILRMAPQNGLPVAGPLQGASFPGLPPQCTLAFSWGTAKPSGRAAKGRIFMPFGGRVDAAADLRLDQASAQAAAAAGAKFIEDLRALEDGSNRFRPGVHSSGLVPQENEITTVRVGRVVDTQRRRRNQLDEDYVQREVAI